MDKMSGPVLKLLPFTENDIDTLIRWLPSREAVAIWGGPSIPFPLTAAELHHHLKDTQGTHPLRHCWTLHHPHKGAIGHAQLACDWQNRVGRIGKVIIAPEVRGQGFAHPLIDLVLAHAFRVDGMERVELNVYPFNTPAIHTYEAQGFIHEGTRRASALVGDQRWDTMIMGILEKEWAALHQE